MLDDSLLSEVQVRLLWAGKRAWEPGVTVRDSVGNALGLYWVREGCLEVDMTGRRWEVPAGSAMLLPSGVRRERIAAGARGAPPTAWLSLGLVPLLYGRLSVEAALGAPRVWAPADDALGRWAGEVVALWEDDGARRADVTPPGRPKTAAARFVSEGLAKAVFGLCWQEAGSAPHAWMPDAPEWLFRALRHLAAAPDTTLPDLCAAVGVGPAHLRRTFHRYVGQSPQAYLTDRRLEAARALLLTTDRTVTTIATDVGFDSPSHFTHLFAQRYGAPPARFRRSAAAAGPSL